MPERPLPGEDSKPTSGRNWADRRRSTGTGSFFANSSWTSASVETHECHGLPRIAYIRSVQLQLTASSSPFSVCSTLERTTSSTWPLNFAHVRMHELPPYCWAVTSAAILPVLQV